MPTFYVLHGDDDLGIDDVLKKFRAEMGSGTEAEMNIAEFDGTTVSVAEVINAVSSYPFLADKRMVIVRGMLAWLTRKGAGQTGKDAIARLQDNLPHLPSYARLIFVERESLTDKHAILQTAQAHKDAGHVLKLTAPSDPVSWIIKRTKNVYQASIDTRAAAALAAVVGEDMRLADNELAKLADYVEPGQPITEDDVAALTAYVPEANIFKMVDAIAEGRGQMALEMLHRLMRDKKQDAFSLFGMITRQFRLLILAREVLDVGGSAGNVASAAKVQLFVAQSLIRQARSFTIDELERIYGSLQHADFDMKTGKIDPALALDLFVAGMTT